MASTERACLGVIAVLLGPIAHAQERPLWELGLGVGAVTLALVLIVSGELLERSLFFTTASPPR